MTYGGGEVDLYLQELKLAIDESELSYFTANSFSEEDPPPAS
jgi:hypothetical protein